MPTFNLDIDSAGFTTVTPDHVVIDKKDGSASYGNRRIDFKNNHRTKKITVIFENVVDRVFFNEAKHLRDGLVVPAGGENKVVVRADVGLKDKSGSGSSGQKKHKIDVRFDPKGAPHPPPPPDHAEIEIEC